MSVPYTPRKKARIHFEPNEGPKKSKSTNPLQKQREQLPIAKGKDALVREIRDNDVTILLGETGSGKTTQVPQYILEAGLAGDGMIAVTQPRRVAATSLAARVAAEQSVTVGGLVGYSVRFDEACQAHTKIKYVSDGMLVRELLSDPILSRYSVVILDEAHERTLRTDFLIANLKTILAKRNQVNDSKGKTKGPLSVSNPLKIVVMSATLDAEKFSRFYNNAPILYVKGRQHPVQIFHTVVSQTNYVDSALRTFFQIHVDKPPGDVLIFLPGQEDIETLDKSIKMYAQRLPIERMQVTLCPMYASLPPSKQARIFASTPPHTRKCILATNIAETSITIPGIKYVIDTGKCKEKRYISKDNGCGFDTLLTRDITKSSAMQRAGRAGREGPGFCFRLYTEEAFKDMAISAEPEIRRCSLTQSVLQLKCLGQDLEEVEFMDPPDIVYAMSALKSLWLLGALDNSKTLTTLGRQMATFPIEPYLARIILTSKTHGCAVEVIDIVSLLSSSSKLFLDVSDQRDAITDARRKFRHPSGDHFTMLNAFRSYQEIAASESKSERKAWCRKHYLNERTFTEALKIRDQLRVICRRVDLDWRASRSDIEEPVLRCFTAGLMQQSAMLQPDGSYKQLMGQLVVKIHPASTLCDKKVPAIIFDELVYTGHAYARGVSSVPRSFLSGITPPMTNGPVTSR
ncbi:P-loop containing nucleoside triphosphate hydrolase protein [Boletus reticuloceps]|uniref:RNA helicase n=1 Tax=Boletus reticuloceps TaxID=495285 RepID=A0A8I2YKX6_9AGAM|nr:P-loop containing nucleoside triphosphate hydrolase protein [Boletus reticuloceps]